MQPIVLEKSQMAFVNERIETPAQSAEFDALKLISPATGQPPEKALWAVDRERQLYFVHLGGGFGEIPDLYALVAQGQRIMIEGRQRASGSAGRDLTMDWQISKVRMPKALAPRADEFLALVREALIAHGWYFDGSAAREVRVSLPAPTFQ